MDLFDRIAKHKGGPIGQHHRYVHGYFTFPKLEGAISAHMQFRGVDHLVWSVNNYLGLADHPEVRSTDAMAAAEFGMAYPMGARIMSGNSIYHEELEKDLAGFVGMEDVLLLNYGYQGMFSVIDALVDRNDVIIYDAESHACIIDGVRLHGGKRFSYRHNDINHLEQRLKYASDFIKERKGSILVITEGVFGMSGDQGKLKDIIALKQKCSFRLLIDDAHGFGTMGKIGSGTHEAQGVIHDIDLYFGTFAKSMASIGAFIASNLMVIEYLRYNVRSQIFAKTLPMPIVIGLQKRLELLQMQPELREQLWLVATTLQNGLKKLGFDIGLTNTMITPIFLKGNLDEAMNLTVDLRDNYRIFCSIVVYPVIPKGLIELRLISTAMHTLKDVQYTLNAYSEIAKKLQKGYYDKKIKLHYA